MGGLFLVLCTAGSAWSDDVFTFEHVAKTRSVTAAEISPDGSHVVYVLSVPRRPFKDDDGPAWAELHVVDTRGNSRPFVTGDVSVGSVAWTPDGRGISFLAKRGDDEHRSLYVIPLGGGRAVRRRCTSDGGRDVRSCQMEPVVACTPVGLAGQPCTVQCAIQPVSGAVPGEHAARPIGAVRGRSETHDENLRVGVPE